MFTTKDDTLYCLTNFHDHSKKQVSKCFVDKQWFVIESIDTINDIIVAQLIQKTYFEEYNPSNEYTPADFSEKRNIELLNGNLGPEILIKED